MKTTGCWGYSKQAATEDLAAIWVARARVNVKQTDCDATPKTFKYLHLCDNAHNFERLVAIAVVWRSLLSLDEQKLTKLMYIWFVCSGAVTMWGSPCNISLCGCTTARAHIMWESHIICILPATADCIYQQMTFILFSPILFFSSLLWQKTTNTQKMGTNNVTNISTFHWQVSTLGIRTNWTANNNRKKANYRNDNFSKRGKICGPNDKINLEKYGVQSVVGLRVLVFPSPFTLVAASASNFICNTTPTLTRARENKRLDEIGNMSKQLCETWYCPIPDGPI